RLAAGAELHRDERARAAGLFFRALWRSVQARPRDPRMADQELVASVLAVLDLVVGARRVVALDEELARLHAVQPTSLLVVAAMTRHGDAALERARHRGGRLGRQRLVQALTEVSAAVDHCDRATLHPHATLVRDLLQSLRIAH